jgi:hypothetical protein
VGDAVLAYAGSNIRAFGIDGGAKLDIGPASFVGYGYYGDGLGTTGLFFNGIALNGTTRKSYGWYAQGSYTFFDRFMIGASYGVSYLEANAFDIALGNSTLVRSNESLIGFARYKLTDWVNLQGEYIHSISRNQAGQAITNDAFVLGTTFFF